MDKAFYLSQLQDYLAEQTQIVTYKWLSRELNVPASVAKQCVLCHTASEPASEPASCQHRASEPEERYNRKLRSLTVTPRLL